MTKHKPIRTCIGCGTCRPKDRMDRYVLDKGIVIADPNQNLTGRGAYLCPSPDCLNRAIKNNSFARAFKRAAVYTHNTGSSSAL